ncbi:hypothetical protein EYF80_038749 [Liparis tanakae]|uniref:Uncharacterized protein n=1 Tax=Liparis tanakae TaxID=230148 RepID=A0A4Z2GCB6_9TELE|nr:hypothetical protein EYF80_038749 [Liparis tanakae]
MIAAAAVVAAAAAALLSDSHPERDVPVTKCHAHCSAAEEVGTRDGIVFFTIDNDAIKNLFGQIPCESRSHGAPTKAEHQGAPAAKDIGTS